MIGITGHTAGIAKYIFDRFNCIGFSRSNGYDIDKEEDRLRIINKIGRAHVRTPVTSLSRMPSSA